MLPIIGICGLAKSGKDTVAGFMVQNHNCVAVAQADPMKAFAKLVFGFTDDQLWGESRELKEKTDPRFSTKKLQAWADADRNLGAAAVWDWIRNLFPYENSDVLWNIHTTLKTWCNDLRHSFGDSLSPRVMLQTLGTEWGRKYSRDMWSDMAIRTAMKLLSVPKTAYARDRGCYESATAVAPAAVVITDVRFQNELINIKSRGGVIVRVDNPEQPEINVGISGHASEAEQKQIPSTWADYVLVNNKKNGLKYLEEQVAALNSDINHQVTLI